MDPQAQKKKLCSLSAPNGKRKSNWFNFEIELVSKLWFLTANTVISSWSILILGFFFLHLGKNNVSSGNRMEFHYC